MQSKSTTRLLTFHFVGATCHTTPLQPSWYPTQPNPTHIPIPSPNLPIEHPQITLGCCMILLCCSPKQLQGAREVLDVVGVAMVKGKPSEVRCHVTKQNNGIYVTCSNWLVFLILSDFGKLTHQFMIPDFSINNIFYPGRLTSNRRIPPWKRKIIFWNHHFQLLYVHLMGVYTICTYNRGRIGNLFAADSFSLLILASYTDHYFLQCKMCRSQRPIPVISFANNETL